MQPRRVPKPGDRYYRPSRARPWHIPIRAVTPRKPSTGSPLVLIYGFAGLIAIGTVLLMLPISSKAGQFTNPIDALFTATSAVCVTGLVVLDTGTYWSAFGQAVILVLIEIGGLGFMTSATILFLAMGRRIGLRERLLIGESVGTIGGPGGMVRIVKRAAKYTLIAQGIGATILFIRFLLEGTPAVTALWKGVFLAISAFNNAGFAILGNFSSLISYQGDATVVLTIAVLIILGGIGFIVVDDIFLKRSFRRLSADSKIVLVTTFSLLVLGTVFLFLSEYSNRNTLGELSFPQKLLVSFFQSATPRTAGFTTIDTGKMVEISLFFTIFLMFIGGASGSFAGGVKVNTLGVLMTTVLSLLRGKERHSAFGREFTEGNEHRALALVVFYLGLVTIVILVLSITEKFGFIPLLFETFSAFGTVGLSTGITPQLSIAGRLIIIIAMFIGRLGPITFISVLTERQRPAMYRYPKETIRIG